MENKIDALIISRSSDLFMKKVDSSVFIYEERVRLNCFNCPRYGVNWTCPPKILNIDYQKVIQEYDNTLLVYCKMLFEKDKFEIVRWESTNLVHRALLDAEKLLWNNDYPLAMSFIGGSCKLCSSGCDIQGCRQPTLARIPLEATGVNVVKTLKQVNININFPPKDFLYRVGLLMW